MLSNLRISSKFLIMVGLSGFGILTVAALDLSTLRGNAIEDRRNGLKEKVLLARQMVELDYQNSKKAGLSEAETMERSKQIFHTLRFGKDDYFLPSTMAAFRWRTQTPRSKARISLTPKIAMACCSPARLSPHPSAAVGLRHTDSRGSLPSSPCLK